jgi:hypothetical protein
MAKDSYKKRMKGNWNQGKSCKGDGEERKYAVQEITQFLKEMDEDYQLPYKKAKRNRNDKARLEHRIAWYEQALQKYKEGHDTSFTHWIRHSLMKAKKEYEEKFGEEE